MLADRAVAVNPVGAIGFNRFGGGGRGSDGELHPWKRVNTASDRSAIVVDALCRAFIFYPLYMTIFVIWIRLGSAE
jgi:hypothetical protein